MLKNRKIAILVDDRSLRRTLYILLVKAGAAVYCANSEDELRNIVEHLDVELAVIGEATDLRFLPSMN